MAMLDKRLKRMEDRILKILPKEGHDSPQLVRSQVKPAIVGVGPVRNTSTKKRSSDEAFGPELDAWATPTPTNNIDGGATSSLLIQEAEEGRLLTEGMDALPSQEIQEHLAEVPMSTLLLDLWS